VEAGLPHAGKGPKNLPLKRQTKGHKPLKRRAESSGVPISPDDAAAIRGMIMRGDRKHDIAAFFGLNPGRVSDIEAGKRFPDVKPAQQDELPPKGPYLTPKEQWQKNQLH
jgi:hypothetical protein